MSGLQSALALLGSLVGLAGIGGGLWAVFRSAAQDATIKRQRDEIADYKGRLDFVEPRLKAAEEQNALLRELQNPISQLSRIEDTGKRTLEVLEEQHTVLNEVAREMHRR